MTPETKRSLWSLSRGLLLGLSIGFGVTINYLAPRVRETARIQQLIQHQLDSVRRVCQGDAPIRVVSYQSPVPPESKIQIMILEGPRLIIKIPNVRKEDLANVLAIFFARGDEQIEAKLKQVLLPQAKQITLIVTTENGK